jgi:hypothetical protein
MARLKKTSNVLETAFQRLAAMKSFKTGIISATNTLNRRLDVIAAQGETVLVAPY